MALHVPKAPGFASMLKDGARFFSGLEEAVIRNIDACKQLANTTRTAYGPNGQNKIVINHLNKTFVTSDAATILSEIEVEHPAAKMLVMATKQQEEECGDGTNFVMIMGGALLEKAEELFRIGLSVPEIVQGYEMALKKSIQILEDLSTDRVEDIHNADQVMKAVKSSIMSKQCGLEDFLSKLITDACLSTMSKDTSYLNVDNIRVCKILGQGVYNSTYIQGMVFKKHSEGVIRKALDAKVVVFTCPLDIIQTETKGTVLINTAQELMDYSKGEENQVEEQIKSIAATGCKVIVCGGKVGELASHYVDKHKLMVVRLSSKWDLRRLCRSIGATPLPRMCTPTQDDMGYCDSVDTDEVGETPVVIFKQDKKVSQVATIVIRGSTDNILDDIERVVNDCVNNIKVLTKDARLLPGAAGTEAELATQLATYGDQCPGLEQYAIKKFAEALHVFPKALAENCGVKGSEILSLVLAAHKEGKKNAGCISHGPGDMKVEDVKPQYIMEPYLVKHWGLRFAAQTACTILRVDQIIMAKRAGGPKPKENKDWDED